MKLLTPTFSLLYLFLWIGTTPSVYGQKVALVLSGGGAKGIAHVGVLKALEANHIPIDYIVGTSMGGVVGGLYAAGYSPDQMEEILLSDDFQRWISGRIAPSFNYYYFQKDPNPAWLSIDLAIDSTLSAALKSNLASDLGLNFALSEMVSQASAACQDNFDNLFVPFRAVSADIFTQEVVVLKSGRLNDALRNTMTVPLFYRPIKNQGRYLFDGGIYNNFAVDVAESEFEPDIIIGVNVSDKNYDTYPYGNDEDLLGQSIQSLVLSFLDKSDSTLIDSTGIYLEPHLDGITSFDFKAAQRILDAGVDEVGRHIGEINSKIKRKNYIEDVSQKRSEYLKVLPPLNFNGIVLKGFKSTQATYVRRFFNVDERNLSIDEIKQKYYRLVSEGYFQDVYPNMVFNPSRNSFDLEIFAKPRNQFKVNFGGTLASRHISMAYLGLELTQLQSVLATTQLNLANGSFFKSLELRSRINFPLQQQLYLEPIYTYNSWDFVDSDDLVIPERIPTLLNQIDRKSGLQIGVPVKTKGKLLLQGAYINNTDFFSAMPFLQSNDRLDKINFKALRVGIEYSNNSLNRRIYANKGNAFTFSVDYFNGIEKYRPGNSGSTPITTETQHAWFRAKISGEQYASTGRFSIGYLAEGVASNQPLFANVMGSQIYSPAFNPLNDSKTLFLQKFRSPSYGTIGLRAVGSFGSKWDIRAEGYLFKPFIEFEEDRFNQPIKTFDLSQFYVAASAGVIYHSPLGPAALTVNYYDDIENQLGILIHLGYLIYNRRSME